MTVFTVLRKLSKTVIDRISPKSQPPLIICLRKIVKNPVKRLAPHLTFIGVVTAVTLNSKMRGKLVCMHIIALGAKQIGMLKKNTRA